METMGTKSKFERFILLITSKTAIKSSPTDNYVLLLMSQSIYLTKLSP